MIELVIDQRRKDLGGFEVGRVLPYPSHRMVGPFIFFDHFGPSEFQPGVPKTMDVRPHPHIGLATVTYLLAGEIMHRDSLATQQAIIPGEVNWMVAGRGITHSERFEKARAEGGPLHGLQAWIALPTEDEETAPSFAHHAGAELPSFEDNGVFVRLIAGNAFGGKSAVQTFSPMFYAHAALDAGAVLKIDAPHPERAAYVVSGDVEVDGRAFHGGQMIVFTPGDDAVLKANAPSVVMLLGGAPVGPRFIDWNFVSSSKDRLEQAKADWRAGRMKLPDLDDQEFIPLPPESQEGPPPPAPPL
jgi:redox-sensitive bicupin YhaK (pirin superfamily)